MYNWKESVKVTKDGKEVFRGTELEMIKFFRDTESFSISYCTKYDGYKIEILDKPIKDNKYNNTLFF
jgi:hypothetical protein